MKHDSVKKIMEDTFTDLMKLREAGQHEYTVDGNAFSNFERVGAQLSVSRETALMIYAFKHFDGISQYVKGRKSQREDVKGRIHDLIVYMLLLKAMVIENESPVPSMRDQMAAQMQGMGGLGRAGFDQLGGMDRP